MMFKTPVHIISILCIFFGSQVVLAKSKSRHSKARAYSYFVDGAKASQGECDGESKIPRNMKKQKDLTRNREYIGSESMESSGTEPSWKHYFTSKPSCNESLRRFTVSK